MKPIYQTSAQLKAKARTQLMDKYSGAIVLLLVIDAISLGAGFFLSMFLPSGSVAAYLIRHAVTFLGSVFVHMFQIGVVLYFLKIACGQPVSLQDMTYGFKGNLEKNLLVTLIMTAISYVFELSSDIPMEMYLSTSDITYIYKALPITLVCMAIYVYVSLLISQVYFLLLDFPNYTVKELFQKSLQLMKGNKWRLFHLEFSFTPLILLSFLTCGIGLLWLMPYMHMASTNFYLDLMNPAQPNVTGSNVDIQV